MNSHPRIRNILAFPRLYDALQGAVGADTCRRIFVNEYARIRPGSRVLDIGCGTARVLRFLPTDVQYTGVDVNPRYIAQDRERYAGRGNFFVGSSGLAQLNERAPFDVVLAMFLMHHLDDEQLLGMCRDASGLLAPDGCLVTIDPCRRTQAGLLERFMMNRDRGPYIRTETEYREAVSRVFPQIEVTVRSDLLRIPYTHCIIRAKMTPANR